MAIVSFNKDIGVHHYLESMSDDERDLMRNLLNNGFGKSSDLQEIYNDIVYSRVPVSEVLLTQLGQCEGFNPAILEKLIKEEMGVN